MHNYLRIALNHQGRKLINLRLQLFWHLIAVILRGIIARPTISRLKKHQEYCGTQEEEQLRCLLIRMVVFRGLFSGHLMGVAGTCPHKRREFPSLGEVWLLHWIKTSSISVLLLYIVVLVHKYVREPLNYTDNNKITT